MINDLRLAVRNLTKMPWFSLAFILTLGLGIGASTAIFSVINGVLLRPLPYPEADRIMQLRQVQTAAGIDDSSVSFAEVADYRSQSQTIDQFVEFGDWTFNVLGRGEPHRATGGLVTAKLLPFKDQAPVGRRLSWRSGNGNWSPPAEIVGVAADTHADGLTEKPKLTMYRADTQTSAVSTLLVRTAGATEQLAPQVVETIRQLDPNRPVDHVQTLEEIRDETIAPQRLNATLIGLFAVLALAIAMVGVAGVLAFSVSPRTNELGIRMALGARPGSILTMTLGEGVTMAGIGLVIGGLAAAPPSRLLDGLLFGVQPLDPPTTGLAASWLVGVALVAAWVPARRAMTVDPMTALRRD